MIGFATTQVNVYPAASYVNLTYAWYLTGGNLQIYENGSFVGSFSTYTTSTILSITFDGTDIKYWKDGGIQRTVARAVGLPLYFGYASVTTGATVT